MLNPEDIQSEESDYQDSFSEDFTERMKDLVDQQMLCNHRHYSEQYDDCLNDLMRLIQKQPDQGIEHLRQHVKIQKQHLKSQLLYIEQQEENTIQWIQNNLNNLYE